MPKYLTLRTRAAYLAAAVVTMLAGLWVHRGGLPLGAAARDVAGDAPWATMIAWGIGALLPAWRMGRRAALAYAVCVVVELSQLAHTPLLDVWRATTLGALLLGSGFDARDLAAYAAGIAVALLVEGAWRATMRARTT